MIDPQTRISLAPMEGVLDPVLRDVLTRKTGWSDAVTEFIRVNDRPVPEKVFIKHCPELLHGGRTTSGVPVWVQLLGGNPERLAAAAMVAQQLGAPGIDLNFGCPAKTVNRHDGGATLLKKPQRLFDVVTAVKRAVDVPVSAKIRLGFDSPEERHGILQALVAAEPVRITVHARTKALGYRPPALWHLLAKLKEIAGPIPLVANGDLFSVQSVLRCQQISGLRDIAIGRGALMAPNLIADLHALKTGQPLPTWSWRDFLFQDLPVFIAASQRYASDLAPHSRENYTLTRSKQWLRYMAQCNPWAQDFFAAIKRERRLAGMRLRLAAEQARWQTVAPAASTPQAATGTDWQ